MADGAEAEAAPTGDASLEKIRRQLTPPAGGGEPLQGFLLKRSETLRRWNQRWFTLDPATAKMDYRAQRGDPFPRGLIHFDADSTITVSPINFHCGACAVAAAASNTRDIGSARKKEYFLCAGSPEAAKAWVATIRAAALVLKAHGEALDSLSSSGRSRSGAVAAAVREASVMAREGAVAVAAAAACPALPAATPAAAQAASQEEQEAAPDSDAGPDGLIVLQETFRVKDEELQQLAAELRSRDTALRTLTARLAEAAEATQQATGAARHAQAEAMRWRKEAEQGAKYRELADKLRDRLQLVEEFRSKGEETAHAALAQAAEAAELAGQEARRRLEAAEKVAADSGSARDAAVAELQEARQVITRLQAESAAKNGHGSSSLPALAAAPPAAAGTMHETWQSMPHGKALEADGAPADQPAIRSQGADDVAEGAPTGSLRELATLGSLPIEAGTVSEIAAPDAASGGSSGDILAPAAGSHGAPAVLPSAPTDFPVMPQVHTTDVPSFGPPVPPALANLNPSTELADNSSLLEDFNDQLETAKPPLAIDVGRGEDAVEASQLSPVEADEDVEWLAGGKPADIGP
eukprot:SM000385S14623  [mRNA]  locus=s385:19125:23382:- [translate_table: standard]